MNNVEYSKKAQKQMRSLPANVRNRVRKKCETYMSDTEKYDNWRIAIMRTDFHRLQVGTFRIVFEIRGEMMFVSKIESCGSVYKRI